jgi:hypothetical protein
VTLEAEPEPVFQRRGPVLPPAMAGPQALAPTPVRALVTGVNAALFESYAGPRLVFGLLMVTLLALGVGAWSGQVRFGPATAVPASTAVIAAATPDLVATQVSEALAATQAAATSALPATPTAAASQPPTSAPGPNPTATTAFLSNTGLVNAGQQVFNETFNPSGYWSTGDNDLSERTIDENQLLIRMKVPGAIAWAVNGYAGEDFYYQGTLRMGACQLGDYAGLAFRVADDDNLYLFGLSCDGRYRVVRRVAGLFETILDFTFTPEAISGSNATNLLAVRAEGQSLSLYINDQFLTQLDVGAAGPVSGLFGVFSKSANTPNLQVSFDDLSAWSLEP